MNVKSKVNVCMLVSNDVVSDPRVTREAISLSKAGFKVTAFGIIRGKLNYIKFKHGFRVIQLSRDTRKQKKRSYLNLLIIRFKSNLARKLKFFPILKDSAFTIYLYVIYKPIRKIIKILEKLQLLYRDFLKFLRRFEVYRNVEEITFIFLFYLLGRTLIFINTKRTSDYDIYHANDLDTLPAAFILSRLNHAKLIYDAHEIWPHQQPNRSILTIKLLEVLEQFLMSRVDKTITVNNHIADHFYKKYNLSDKPIAIMNCVRFTRISDEKIKKERKELIRKFNFDPRALIVLYQGKFAIQRGVEQLILAAKNLPEKIVIIIRGPINDHYYTLIDFAEQNHVLNKKVFFDEPVSLQQLVLKASAADIGMLNFIPLSLNNRYILPNKLFEYMCAGLAVIASDLPALKEVVNDSKAGMLIEQPYASDITNALKYYSQHRQVLKRYRENAIIAAQKKYNWKNEEKKLIRIYQNLIA